MPAIDIKRWMLSLLARLHESRQRQLVSLQGSREWCLAQLESLSELDPQRLGPSSRADGEYELPSGPAQARLGGEARLVVLDLFDGFDPDALCIGAGLVQAGGVLLLLSPPPERWDLCRDRYACWQDQDRSTHAGFVDYFFTELARGDPSTICLTPDSVESEPARRETLTPIRIERGLTADQARALQTLEQWLARDETGVALLVADRGRGKSHCLGTLCQRLQTRVGVRILLSAGSRRAAAGVLKLAPETEFIAPDSLLLRRPEADLVVIDEAAMIPLALLRQICDGYSRVLLATTSDGYEGTGQGFMLRFIASLDPQRLLRIGLTEPVRWCAGDGLESWINRVLMLQQERPDALPESAQAAADEAIEFRLLTEPGALAQRDTIAQVYRLLSSAHYRTRPSDLRMLMENPALRILVACRGERVIGATLLNLEGGFDAELCREVFLGRRRPRGHLLAQMITAQAGVEGFAERSGLRILRIAVVQEYRRRRVASGLLERAAQLAGDAGCAWIGASFALDARTTEFWRHNDYRLAHVSFAAGKSSGAHSIAVLRALEPELDRVLEKLQLRIRKQLRIWLTQYLRSLDAEQVTALLKLADYRVDLDAEELAEVDAFADGQRGFELCFASLQQYVMQAIAQSGAVPERLLIEKAVQNRNWELLSRNSGAEGRRQLQRRLRGLVDRLRKD